MVVKWSGRPPNDTTAEALKDHREVEAPSLVWCWVTSLIPMTLKLVALRKVDTHVNRSADGLDA